MRCDAMTTTREVASLSAFFSMLLTTITPVFEALKAPLTTTSEVASSGAPSWGFGGAARGTGFGLSREAPGPGASAGWDACAQAQGARVIDEYRRLVAFQAISECFRERS